MRYAVDSLDEAETARGLLIPVETHDDSFDVADAAEELVDLLLGREEAAAGSRDQLETE